MSTKNKDTELKMLDTQARMVAEQLDRLDTSMAEVEYLKDSLDELSKLKKDSEILAPMSSGIFVKAKLQDTKTLLVNIGKDIVVEKTVEETKELLEERSKEMTDVREKLMQQMQELEEKLVKLGEE